jgi:hypothetical protein
MLPLKFAVAGTAIHEMLPGPRGMLRNIGALSSAAELCLAERGAVDD